MFIALSTINILLLLLLAFMLIINLFQPKSRAQMAFILFDVFVMVFVFGMEMELLHSSTVDAALSGLAMQYFGQCGFLMAILWFTNEFINLKLPRGVFVIQIIISMCTMFGVMTAGLNKLFYTRMVIIHEGLYARISCDNGILWYVHYGYFMIVFLAIIVFCILKYHTMGPIHRKRILYMAVGLGILSAELILKALGFFGAYNPVTIALTGTVMCLMLAVMKEGYFESVDATMENVLNHGDEGLIVLDAWSRVVFVNNCSYNLFPDIRIGYPLSAQKSLSAIMGKEEKYLNINGIVWEVRLEDILDNGTKTGTMMYFINVTVLVRQSEQLRTVNEERVRFMAKASHELRSPLNVILGADEMLLREIRDPSVREYAELIREEVGGMVNLVEDIINSSLAEQEMLSIKEETFSLKESLVHLCNIYKRKAEAKNLSFTFFWDGESVDKHPDLMLSGDRNRIKQILINLLENAIKYTEKGEIKLVVTEKNHADGKYLIEFIVSDTGTGIPEAEQNAVFEKYKRGHEAENSGKEGLGLGLSIVKGFVEAMGGNIHLESHSGIGSNFIVLLPLKEAEFSGNEKVFEDEKNEIGTAAFSGGRKILAVDDRPRNILVMQRLLKDSGISVDEADCGADAVDLCRKVSYDALIIDFMMPGMNGIETLKAIRSDQDGKNTDTYAIVFSANVTPDAEKMYREAGFSDFLPKPFFFDDLIQTLRKAFYSAGDSAGAEHESMDEGEQILRRLRDTGVDTKAGIAYSDDDRDFYLKLLRSFSESYTQDLEELQNAYGAILEGSRQLPNGLDSWKEFTRLAHGIKGELRAFGDSQGAELFYTLEKAGKAEKRENLEETYAQAVSHLDYLVKIIQGDCPETPSK